MVITHTHTHTLWTPKAKNHNQPPASKTQELDYAPYWRGIVSIWHFYSLEKLFIPASLLGGHFLCHTGFISKGASFWNQTGGENVSQVQNNSVLNTEKTLVRGSEEVGINPDAPLPDAFGWRTEAPNTTTPSKSLELAQHNWERAWFFLGEGGFFACLPWGAAYFFQEGVTFPHNVPILENALSGRVIWEQKEVQIKRVKVRGGWDEVVG